MSRRTGRRMLAAVAALGWLVFVWLTVVTLVRGTQPGTGDVFQVDWHVYWAGARDLVDGSLYRESLDAGGRELSTDTFNLPPASAAVAVPLLPLPVVVGGIVWQALAAVSIAVAALATAVVAGVRRPAAAAGIAVGVLAPTLLYLEGLHLGTNNYLVLGVVAVAILAYVRGRDVPAGVLLGLAIAIKLWPAALLVVAARERRLRVTAWGVGTAGIGSVALFLPLGTAGIVGFLDAMRADIPATGYLIGPGAVTGLRGAWIGGVGLVVGVVLVLLPTRGRLALGLALLAGLCPITNLWIHYAPTVLVALVLLVAGTLAARQTSPIEDEPAVAQHAPA